MEAAEASGADPREDLAAAAGGLADRGAWGAVALGEGRLAVVRIAERRATAEGGLSAAHITEVPTMATAAEFWAEGIATDTRAIEAPHSGTAGVLRVASTDFRAAEVQWPTASGTPLQDPVELLDFPGLGVLLNPRASAMSALRYPTERGTPSAVEA